jgi:hypothetical protein
MQFDTGLLLEIANDVKEIACLRIAAGTEHPDETLGLGAGSPAEFLEAHGRLDVVAQDRFAGINVASQHQVNPFAQEGISKGTILGDVLVHQIFETSCHWYLLASIGS